ncbi:MFS nicotinic acid transporter-like protein [Bisporella sp. PMI_857]|nr:MFS nicotinic acid transporter-like protein [Bisporella sp. PMI_857]
MELKASQSAGEHGSGLTKVGHAHGHGRYRVSRTDNLSGGAIGVNIAASPPDEDPDPGPIFSAEECERIDRLLVRKLDWRLIPWLCVLYLLSFLDRTNIGNAKIAVPGLQESLGNMSTGRYNACLTIFFISYAIAEPATNVLLKRFKPSIFIPVIMILWGVCMTSMGFVRSWSGLMTARWFLGLTEAGLYPGVNYLLSCWYKRDEFGIRAAIFFSAAAFSGSFGGLLAAAITKLNGIGGRPGWAWIFIIEGVLTIVFGVLSFWMVHDFPDTATFLSERDRARVIHRLSEDQQSSAQHEDFKMSYFWAALKDYKMWLGMFIYMGVVMPLYAFSLFLPTIIAQMGYKSTQAQLMSVPPYACAAVLTIAVGYLADHYLTRGVFNICVSLIGVAGFAMQLASQNPHLKYAGTFLGALGIYPCIANTISWMSNNIEGVYKRGVVLGFVIGWGNLNGVVSSNIYFEKPKFTVGHATVMGYMIVCLFGGSLLMTILLRRENAARRAGRRAHLIEGFIGDEVEILGDMRPDFLYVV